MKNFEWFRPLKIYECICNNRCNFSTRRCVNWCRRTVTGKGCKFRSFVSASTGTRSRKRTRRSSSKWRTKTPSTSSNLKPADGERSILLIRGSYFFKHKETRGYFFVKIILKKSPLLYTNKYTLVPVIGTLQKLILPFSPDSQVCHSNLADSYLF